MKVMKFCNEAFSEYEDIRIPQEHQVNPGNESQKTENTPIDTKNNSLELYGPAMFDASGKVLNQSISRIGGGKIEAAELSGILYQTDNSLVYNTEKPNSNNISAADQMPYRKSALTNNLQQQQYQSEARDQKNLRTHQSGAPFGSVVYHGRNVGSDDIIMKTPCVNNFMSIGGSVADDDMHDYGMHT